MSDAETRRLPSDRQLRNLAVVATAGVSLAATNRLSGGLIGLPCPWHLLTGLDCPLCGSTRMVGALLSGELTEALRYNAPALFIGLGFGYLMLAWMLQRFTNRSLPRPRLSRAGQRRLAVAGIVIAGVFTVVRNLPWELFTQLSV